MKVGLLQEGLMRLFTNGRDFCIVGSELFITGKSGFTRYFLPRSGPQSGTFTRQRIPEFTGAGARGIHKSGTPRPYAEGWGDPERGKRLQPPPRKEKLKPAWLKDGVLEKISSFFSFPAGKAHILKQWDFDMRPFVLWYRFLIKNLYF